MTEQNKDVVRRYYAEVVNGRDLDAVGDYFADERMVEGVRRGCFVLSPRSPTSTSASTSSSPKATPYSCARP